MTFEEFKELEAHIQKLAPELLEEDDRIAVIVRNFNGHIDFSGTDCIVCLVKWLQTGIDEGFIKHKSQHEDVEIKH